MRRLSGFPLMAGVVCLSGCLSAADPAEDPHETVLAITIVDSAGAPVPGSLVGPHFWPDTASWWQYGPHQRADSLGRVLVDLTTAPVTRLDSLDVAFVPPGCDGFAWRYAVVQASTLYGGSDDTARVELRTGPTRPPARTAPGEYCAFGYPTGFEDPFDGRDMFLALRVDSLVGPLAYGRWQTWTISTRGGSWGSFVAGHGSTFIAFHLAVDSTSYSGPCTGFRFTAPVRPDGIWGTALVIEPNECFHDFELPVVFDFVEEKGHFWWW